MFSGISFEVVQLQRLSPLVFWLACSFYASTLLLLVVPIRRSFVRLFTPLAPVTQSAIKPLDSMRGLAALGIASFHLWAWMRPYFDRVAFDLPLIKQTYKAVPVFVILSGFLIYRSLRGYQSIEDLRHYVKRRIFRIYPLYVVSVLGYFLLANITPQPWSWAQRLLPEIFMMKVFGFPAFIYPAYWSLYVEELFYIALPLWIACTSSRPMLSAALGLALFSFIGTAVPDDLSIVKYFFFGILLCELLDTKWIRTMSQLNALGFLLVGASSLYVEATHGDVIGEFISALARRYDVNLAFNHPANPSDPYSHYYTFLLGLGISSLLIGVVHFRPVNRLLSAFPFRFLGTISYSLFIWNGLILLVGTNIALNSLMPTIWSTSPAFEWSVRGSWISLFGAYLPAFIFAAAVSYLVIERPFMLLRRSKITTKPQVRVHDGKSPVAPAQPPFPAFWLSIAQRREKRADSDTMQ